MRRSAVFGLATFAALVFGETALGVSPAFISLGHENRHPTARVSAPRASSVTIYMASKPDRSTDGSFLSENVERTDFLTDSEIQSGSWLFEDQVDPGTYYVMLNADPDFGSCYRTDIGGYDPACASGFSSVAALVIPKPASKYTVSVRRYRFVPLDLTIRATPLGEDRPYRVCYRLKSRRRVCLRGTLNGYSWNSSAEDTLDASTRNLATFTTFTWYVGSRAVARKRARVK